MAELHEKRKLSEFNDNITLNHMLGHLIGTAFHNPKKYPQLKSLLAKAKKSQKDDRTEMRRQISSAGMRIPGE